MYQSAKLKEPIKLKALAKVINAEIIGNAEVSIDSFCALSEPVRGALTFSKSVRYSAIKEVVEKAQVAAVII